jgi:hypothetical protein
MSNRPRHAVRMKIKNRYQFLLVAHMFQSTTIAHFGPARLVRKPDGRHELIGGTTGHRVAAREWCSIFAPEVVFNTSGIPHGSDGPIARGAAIGTNLRVELRRNVMG